MVKKKEILAIIPARGGSKGIPGKNIKFLNGKPLIVHSIEAAKNAVDVDRVVVSTDDNEIEEISRSAGVLVIKRPWQIAEDVTPMDPVLTHAVEYLKQKENYVPDFVVLLQPTSPLRTHRHINEAIKKFFKNTYDSLASVEIITNNQHKIDENDRLVPVFKKTQNRDRRDSLIVENGAIYISKVDLIKKGKIRGNKIGYYEMDKYSSIDIDEPQDFEMAERLLSNLNL